MKNIITDKRLLKAMLFTTLIFMGMNFGHPVTPRFINNVGIDENYFSILFGTMALMTLLFAPFWGVKGDKYGRRIVISIGIFGYGVGQIFFGLSSELYLILIARAISGMFAAAIFANFVATYSEISTNEQRPKYVSIYTSLTMVSGSVGYLIGGSLGNYFTAGNTIVIQGVFDILVGISVFCFFPATTILNKSRTTFKSNIKNLKSIDSKIIILLLSTTFFVMGQNNNAKFLDLFLFDKNFSTAQNGMYVFLTGIVSAVTAIIVVPIVAKKFKDLNILKTCSIGIVIIFLITLNTNNLKISMYCTYLIYTMFVSVYVALDQTFLSRQVTKDYGSVMGIRESFRSLGLVIGPLVGGSIFYKEGTLRIFYFDLGLFVISCILLITFIRSRKIVN